MTDLTALGLPADLPEIAAPTFMGGYDDVSADLSQQQKAAIIVRVLLSDGRTMSLSQLTPEIQVSLTREIGAIRQIDQATLSSVVDEFIGELDGGGMSFSGGLQEALSMLDGSISAETARRLSREEGIKLVSDPWKRLVEFDAEKLAPLAERESVEVASVLLSKLTYEKSAGVLALMAGDTARRAAYAVSQTTKIRPDAVRTIGRALLAQLDAEPRRAFSSLPVDRVAAILNSANSGTRDDVLEGLQEEDAEFAEEVRKSIFTFANIAVRVDTRDVPKITREVDPGDLTRALKYGTDLGKENAASAEFILGAMSKRMAESIREEMDGMAAVKPKAGEAALDEVVAGIRRLEQSGEMAFKSDEDDED